MMVKVKHTLNPFYDSNSKILILGSMPSVKSRELGFYYMHPQNRFWKVLADVLNEPMPSIVDERQALLKKYHIALWDVLASCDIDGSSDSSIKNAKPNDINQLLKETKITAIFVTGKKALTLYNKLCLPKTNISCIYLPSTSPANCAFSSDALINEYKKILDYLI